MKLTRIALLLCSFVFVLVARQHETPTVVGDSATGIPNHVTDFGVWKGFVSRSSWSLIGRNKPFRLNLSLFEFFYAPGVKTNTTPTSYPSDRLDPDVLAGAAIGLGPQVSVTGWLYLGADIAIGGGMSGVQWKDIEDVSSSGFMAVTTYEYGYDWVPGWYVVSSAHLGLAFGRKRKFALRFAACPVYVTGRNQQKLTFTPSVSAGFGL